MSCCIVKHHGIMGMHWGVRRYQNKDGSLTPAGVKRYGREASDAYKQLKSSKKAYKKARLHRSIYGTFDAEDQQDYNKKKNFITMLSRILETIKINRNFKMNRILARVSTA